VKNLDELFKDEDFQQSELETQRWAASKVDQTFASQPKDAQTKLLEAYRKGQKRVQDGAGTIQQESAQLQAQVAPQAPQPTAYDQPPGGGAAPTTGSGPSRWNRAVQPLTTAVGRGLQGMDYLLQGKNPFQAGQEQPGGMAQFGAEMLVPQEAWQAGAMAIPGAGPLLKGAGRFSKIAAEAAPVASNLAARAGGLGRIAGGALGAAGAEQLVEGEPAQPGAAAFKGAAVNTVGELLGKLIGVGRRHLRGGKQRVSDEGAGAFMDVLSDVSPAAMPPGQAGTGASRRLTYEVSGDPAQARVADELRANLREIQAQLGPRQGFYSPILEKYYQGLQQRAAAGNLEAAQALQQVKVDKYGQFDADSVVQMIALLKDDVAKNLTDASGKIAGSWKLVSSNLMRSVLDEVAHHLSTSAGGPIPRAVGDLLGVARKKYGAGMAVRDLLDLSLISPSKKGGRFNQEAADKFLYKHGAELRKELGDELYERLVDTVTRGGGLRSVDVPGHVSMPYMSPKGFATAAARSGPTQYAGSRKPLTVPQVEKAELNALSQMLWRPKPPEE